MNVDIALAHQKAMEAAREAGTLIRTWIGRPTSTTAKSSPHDLVTEVDKACQEVITRILQDAFPTSVILGDVNLNELYHNH